MSSENQEMEYKKNIKKTDSSECPSGSSLVQFSCLRHLGSKQTPPEGFPAPTKASAREGRCVAIIKCISLHKTGRVTGRLVDTQL